MKSLGVYLSPTACKQFESLCQYLTEEWSNKVKQDFVARLDKKFSQISSLPESCPESQEISGLRKAVVDKRTSFFYRISVNSIEVLTIFDNRQSQQTIKKTIKTGANK